MAITVCAVAVPIGLGGYFVAGHRPIFAVAGLIALIATVVLLALAPDRAWVPADDLRRADDHEEHKISDGPAPPFQS